MSKKLIPLLVFIVLICQLTVITSAKAAQNIEDLVEQGKLTISLKVNQKEQHIVGQALILAIDISTDRWFATGSKIQPFALQNVVMQANNTTTINGSENIKGQTWATQIHEITLYPTVSGTYQVPPINIELSVNTEHHGIISGVLSTQESSFTIELPKALAGIENFIVSPQVTLNIDGQFDQEKDYAVGQAITQTITIIASDTPAMMIMPINLAAKNLVTAGQTTANDKSTMNKVATEKATLDGISIYHKPAQVFDKSNRGSLIGTRVESFTYIFEKPGRYVIDEQVVYWWNSQTSTLERLLIPSSAWTVSDGGLSKITTANYLKSFNFTIKSVINSIIVIVLLILISLGFIKRHYLSTLYNKLTKREQRLLRSEFINAVIQKDYLIATQFLYQYAVLQNKQTFTAGCSQSVILNKLAFNANSTENVPTSFSVNEAKVLIRKIDAITSKKEDAANFTPKERINLNSD